MQASPRGEVWLDEHVAEILSYLDASGSLEGTWEPLRIYFTCYQVLQSLPDTRAGQLLETAYQLLQEQALAVTHQLGCMYHLLCCSDSVIVSLLLPRSHPAVNRNENYLAGRFIPFL